jgi:uncharacterized protein (DUF362 family)
MKPVVSLVRYTGRESVSEAIDLCGGFSELAPDSRVLLKPNICTAQAGFFPPFGTVTTTAVIEGVVRALKDAGINRISLGEGTVLDELGTNTRQGFRWIGLQKLKKRYGITLIDFNKGPHRKIRIGRVPMNIAGAALDTDFFINIPVLKTHIAARVSLSSKNLKGCLSMASKKYFHGKKDTLHTHISRIMEAIPQHLVVIDGLYVMDHGPDATTGTAYPRGVIAASTDFLAADSVGTRLLGGDPTEVPHLRLYAERHGRMDILSRETAVRVVGEELHDHAKFIGWDAVTGKDMAEQGHTGIEIREIRNTVCSGCYANLTGPTLLLSALSKNKDFGDLTIIVGKNTKETRNSPRTFLFGDCAIRENRKLDRATRVSGCPPSFFTSCFLLANQMQGFWNRVSFFTRLILYFARALFKVGMLPLPRYEIYKNNPDYDIGHFKA